MITMRSWISRVLWFCAGILAGPLAAIAVIAIAPTPALVAVMDRVQIDTSRPPMVYFRTDMDVYPTRYCWRVDSSRISELLVTGWMPLGTYINLTGQFFGVDGLTANERALCFASMPPLPPKPAVPPVTVVPSGTAPTAPLYSIQQWETSGLWLAIGRVERGQVCEPGIVRKTTVSYYYVTNIAGLRGLAACK